MNIHVQVHVQVQVQAVAHRLKAELQTERMTMNQFSDEQLVGQRLMVGFDGTDLNSDLKFLIDTVKVGGMILFARNLATPEQMKDLCRSAQAYAQSCGQPPLFVAIDQEGGKVARLKAPFTQFPGNPSMKGEADARHFAEVTAAELKGVGINMNMAPVMDVATGDSVMAERAFGSDPAWVAKMGVKVIEGFQKNGIMPVAKHFPGIGRTSLDSHDDMPVLDVEPADLAYFDLPPFDAAVTCGVTGIMLSHILYNRLDPEWPASLSPDIAKGLLRERMRFEGLVMTDDLDMGAIRKHYPIETCIRQILLADIDIALICHKGPAIEKTFEEMVRHLKDDEDIRERGEVSVQRILRVKREA